MDNSQEKSSQKRKNNNEQKDKRQRTNSDSSLDLEQSTSESINPMPIVTNTPTGTTSAIPTTSVVGTTSAVVTTSTLGTTSRVSSWVDNMQSSTNRPRQVARKSVPIARPRHPFWSNRMEEFRGLPWTANYLSPIRHRQSTSLPPVYPSGSFTRTSTPLGENSNSSTIQNERASVTNVVRRERPDIERARRERRQNLRLEMLRSNEVLESEEQILGHHNSLQFENSLERTLFAGTIALAALTARNATAARTNELIRSEIIPRLPSSTQARTSIFPTRNIQPRTMPSSSTGPRFPIHYSTTRYVAPTTVSQASQVSRTRGQAPLPTDQFQHMNYVARNVQVTNQLGSSRTIPFAHISIRPIDTTTANFPPQIGGVMQTIRIEITPRNFQTQSQNSIRHEQNPQVACRMQTSLTTQTPPVTITRSSTTNVVGSQTTPIVSSVSTQTTAPLDFFQRRPHEDEIVYKARVYAEMAAKCAAQMARQYDTCKRIRNQMRPTNLQTQTSSNAHIVNTTGPSGSNSVPTQLTSLQSLQPTQPTNIQSIVTGSQNLPVIVRDAHNTASSSPTVVTTTTEGMSQNVDETSSNNTNTENVSQQIDDDATNNENPNMES